MRIARHPKGILNPSLVYGRHTQTMDEQKSYQRHSIFTLDRGDLCCFSWPEPMSAADFDDVCAWLDLIKRRLGRSGVERIKPTDTRG